MSMEKSNVCILIPTLNEERTIGDIIKEFQELGYTNILVIDGHSTDRTVKIAEDLGARVIVQSEKGKGQAIQQAFSIIEDDVTVMIDGDGTYLPSEVECLLEPIYRGDADHVIGNRLADYKPGAFTRLNMFGNKVLNKAFGIGYGRWLEDILSGYRAFTKDAIKEMDLNKLGFETEAEMTIESVKKDFRISEVPITYRPRPSGVRAKLAPLRDGIKIGSTLYGLVKTHNPVVYFGLIGILIMAAGAVSGAYVILEWIGGVNRTLLALATILLILLGAQMFILGVLGDIFVSLQKEMMREIKSLRK